MNKNKELAINYIQLLKLLKPTNSKVVQPKGKTVVSRKLRRDIERLVEEIYPIRFF